MDIFYGSSQVYSYCIFTYFRDNLCIPRISPLEDNILELFYCYLLMRASFLFFKRLKRRFRIRRRSGYRKIEGSTLNFRALINILKNFRVR